MSSLDLVLNGAVVVIAAVAILAMPRVRKILIEAVKHPFSKSFIDRN